MDRMDKRGTKPPAPQLLEAGLSIIAACRAKTGDIWEAHFGAAAIACYFFLQDNALPPQTARLAAAEALAMIARHAPDSGVDRPAAEGQQRDAREPEAHGTGESEQVRRAVETRRVREEQEADEPENGEMRRKAWESEVKRGAGAAQGTSRLEEQKAGEPDRMRRTDETRRAPGSEEQGSVEIRVEAHEADHEAGETQGVQERRADPGYSEAVIVEALEETIDRLHWVGHNAIYAAHSLMAVRELGGWGTEREAAAIAGLIRSFAGTIPGRSWIGYSASEVKRMQISDADAIPVIDGPAELSAFVLAEMRAFDRIYRAEAHSDLIGHMLTFSHALNILHDLGYEALFRRGVTPLLILAKTLRRSRSLTDTDEVRLLSPVDRLPLTEAHPSPYLPDEPDYWLGGWESREWAFGHLFKFPCSFYDHLCRAPEERLASAERFRSVLDFV